MSQHTNRRHAGHTGQHTQEKARNSGHNLIVLVEIHGNSPRVTLAHWDASPVTTLNKIGD